MAAEKRGCVLLTAPGNRETIRKLLPHWIRHSLVKQHINELVSTKTANFANARTIRNYFELIITQQATRISSIANPSENDVQSIIIDDVQKIVIS